MPMFWYNLEQWHGTNRQQAVLPYTWQRQQHPTPPLHSSSIKGKPQLPSLPSAFAPHWQLLMISMHDPIHLVFFALAFTFALIFAFASTDIHCSGFAGFAQ
eukprot:3308147-Rhodomonas_salina.1